jgi:hypothetical protein
MQMRTYRISVTAIAALLALGAIASIAGARGASSGTWTFTDTTPDPTVVANDATQHCETTVPAGPADVNSQAFKTSKPGILTLTSHNALDWAMEVKDSKGNIVTGTDGSNPNDPENMIVSLSKGSYEVIYCNFSGEPSITVDYSFKKGK